MNLEEELEKELRCRAIQVEGLEAIGVKIFWNRQYCPYRGKCYLQEETEKNQPKPCLFNPKMFRCPAYQHYARGGE